MGVLDCGYGADSRRGVRCSTRALSARALAEFYNLHTGESLNAVYCENGRYIDGAQSQINYILRDFRANEIKPIDPRLLDLLYSINRGLYTAQPLESSPATARRQPTRCWRRAAKAWPVTVCISKAKQRIFGCRTGDSGSMARGDGLWSGGVGFYPRSDFVHVDVGRPRFW